MSSIKSLNEWLAEIRAASTMRVELASVDGMPPWSLQADPLNGLMAFRRDDGNFFQLVGVEVGSQNREVKSWYQPMLQELPQGGYVVLATEQSFSEFIVTAREEPGNPADKNYILLGAPVQMSYSNFHKGHGGNRPPRADWVDGAMLFDQWQDGGRYYAKVNQVGYKIFEDLHSVELAPNERIATRAELSQALRHGDCNAHLAETLGVILV